MTERVHAYSGDTIEAADGRIGVVVLSSYSMTGDGHTEYGIALPGDPPMQRIIMRDDAARMVRGEDVVRILSHGRHDYRPNKAHRGHCARCDAPKQGHA